VKTAAHQLTCQAVHFIPSNTTNYNAKASENLNVI